VRIGVDVGGTKIELAAFDASDAVLLRRRIASPAHDYVLLLEAVAALVETAERELGARGSVGVGTPGAASYAGGALKNANSTVLIGRPFQSDLERRLRRTIRIANDANCFALSEATDGAAAGCAVVFCVIFCTGGGGGIGVDGRLIAGRNAIAGEWGHNPLPWPEAPELPGPACYCGKRGCIETFLSGPGLVRDHAALRAATLTAPQIAAAAEAGDEPAQASLERYASRLARALASVINVLDPDVVVLGGGLSNVLALYERVPALLGAYVFSDVVETRIVRAAHGDASGVRGAAWLWPAQ
jgi:fructokinase